MTAELENPSHYDPSRETVGAIYRKAQLNNRVEHIETGDMTREIMKSMVDDLNETIETGTKEFEGREFYITMHEKKDLQMPSCILRRCIKTLYRPWPEDDTLVFRVIPAQSDVRFCWCLPHASEMPNMLASVGLFDAQMVNMIRSWMAYDLYCFGFEKTDMGHWIPNLNWVDQPMTAQPPISKPSILLPVSSSTF